MENIKLFNVETEEITEATLYWREYIESGSDVEYPLFKS